MASVDLKISASGENGRAGGYHLNHGFDSLKVPLQDAGPWANGRFTTASAADFANFLLQEKNGMEQLVRWHGAEKVQARLSPEVMWRYLLDGNIAKEISVEKIDKLAALLQRAECSGEFTSGHLLTLHATYGHRIEKSALRELFRQIAAHPLDEEVVRNHARQLPLVLNRMSYEQLLETAGTVSRKLEASLYLTSRGLWSDLGVETDKRLATRIKSRAMSAEDIDVAIRHLGHGHKQFSNTLQVLSKRALALNGSVGIQRLGELAAVQMDANVYDKDVFRCITDELSLQSGNLSAVTRWQILYAFASANLYHPSLAPLLHSALRENVPAGHQALGRAIWTVSALVACGLKPDTCMEFYRRASDAITQFGPMTALFPTRRLYHLALLLDQPFNPHFVPALREWEHRIALHPPSRTCSEYALARSLREWGIEYQQAPILFACTPDFVVQLNGARWIIECDGASCHFVGGQHDNGQRGDDLVRDKIFHKQGYGVLRVAAHRPDASFTAIKPLLESLKGAPIPQKTIFDPQLIK